MREIFNLAAVKLKSAEFREVRPFGSMWNRTGEFRYEYPAVSTIENNRTKSPTPDRKKKQSVMTLFARS